MLPKPNRLARRRDFAAVYGRKKSWANPLLVLHVRWYAKESADAETRRFGFSVSKKVGKAHDRNGVKRRLRELCRLVGNPSDTEAWRQGFDAVFVARSESVRSTYAELENAARELGRRAGVLRATDTASGVSDKSGKETETGS
ncbi:MAG: ribonuclease P protein component [Akkermansiaceae bacterium]|nr:ribonuclease P protein component [Armatimonadota bacterium]